MVAHNISVKDLKKIDFSFSNGKITENVLRNYLSRAVSFQGLCVENTTPDFCFEDDLRMIKYIGAKFIGRAAFYSWGGDLNNEQIENHFKLAEEKAKLAHEVDTELILQAGVFEIMYKGTVESTPVPTWVLEEFGQTATERNFKFDDMLPPEGSRFVRGFWGHPNSAVPYIGSVETQMYIYYLITRYIDAGFEAIHLGQVDFIMNLDNQEGSERLNDWDTVLTKARTYAKKYARRGIVLFDCHRELNSNGFKIGDRMLSDYYACGAVPHETEIVEGAECAQMLHCDECGVSWIGRSPGGLNPLGFYQEKAFTIAEFDNFNGAGGAGGPHVKTENDVFCWGYDIITWYATQPEWYRNQYLLECDDYFKSIELDSEGRQTYFIQAPCRRTICPEPDDRPIIKYNIKDKSVLNSLTNYFKAEAIEHQFDENTCILTLIQNKEGIYRANNRKDVCPTGSNQENTIRKIFLGEEP